MLIDQLNELVKPCTHGTECKHCCFSWLGRFNKSTNRPDFHTSSKRSRIAARLLYEESYGVRLVTYKEATLHKCNNGACMNVAHFYRGTYQQNAYDRTRAGNSPRGKVSPEKAAELFAWYKTQPKKHGLIRKTSRELGIHENTLRSIVKGKSFQ